MRLSLLLTVAAVSLMACGGQSDPIGPDLDDAEVTARIDGEGFVSATASVVREGGRFTISASATNPARLISFTFPDVGTATHTIGAGFPSAATVTIQGQPWGAGGSAGGGSVSVTSVSDSRITGTFSFGLVATGGQQPANLSVTQGQFDIRF